MIVFQLRSQNQSVCRVRPVRYHHPRFAPHRVGASPSALDHILLVTVESIPVYDRQFLSVGFFYPSY